MPVTATEEGKFHGFRLYARCYGNSVEMVHGQRHLVPQLADFFDLFDPAMLPRRFLEVHSMTERIPDADCVFEIRGTGSGKKRGGAGDFGRVLFRAHPLLAGPQAPAHLSVNAAGVFWGRLQVILAPAELEQVQKLSVKALGGRPAGKRTDIDACRTGQK